MRPRRAYALAAALVLAAGAAAAAGHSHGAHASPPDAPPLLDGLGAHHHAVTTASPDAQRYFDQGLRLVYAFNHDEAIARLPRGGAARPRLRHGVVGRRPRRRARTTTCPIDDERDRAAREAMREGAVALAPKASAAERAYIAALATRYVAAVRTRPQAARSRLRRRDARAWRGSTPTTSTPRRSSPSRSWILRPWDLWTLDGAAAARHDGDRRRRSRACSRRDPDHPGANHYYIHAVEASPRSGARARRAPSGCARSCPAPATSCTCRRTSTCASDATPTRPRPTGARSRPTSAYIAAAEAAGRLPDDVLPAQHPLPVVRGEHGGPQRRGDRRRAQARRRS